MDIKEAIKQLEDLKKDRLSFVTGDKEHDEIYLKDVQAIEIVLGNLVALIDMQKSADKELENAKKVNEEHKEENGKLKEKIKKLEETIVDYQRMYCRASNDRISKQKIKNKIKVLEMEEDYDYLNHKKAIEILKELLEDK